MDFLFENWHETILYLVMLCFFVLFLSIYIAELKRLLKHKADEKRYTDFEKALIDETVPDEERMQFFNGEIKLPEQIQITIPIEENQSFDTRVLESIQSAVTENELGHVIRSYTLADIYGIDVQLHDFVSGIEVLREILMELEIHQETSIEYRNGEIFIYE